MNNRLLLSDYSFTSVSIFSSGLEMNHSSILEILPLLMPRSAVHWELISLKTQGTLKEHLQINDAGFVHTVFFL